MLELQSYSINYFRSINNMLDASLLEDGICQKLVNCNLQNGKINALKSYSQVIKNEDFVTNNDINRSVVKWYENDYWTNNARMIGQLNYESSNGEGLGVEPNNIDNFTFSKVTATTQEVGLTGKFKYAITNINLTKYESVPVFFEIELNKQFVDIEVKIDNLDLAKFSEIKIYRTGESSEDFFYVSSLTIDNGIIAVKKIEDRISAMQLPTMELCQSKENFLPPKNGRFLCEAGSVFFLAVGSKLYFSQLANPHAWHSSKWIQIDSDISAIIKFRENVIICSNSKTYFASNFYDINAISLQQIANFGCGAMNLSTSILDVAVWFNSYDICVFDGQQIQKYSQNVYNLRDANIKQILATESKIYMLAKTKIVVWDQKYNAFYDISLSANFGWYDELTKDIFLEVQENYYIKLFSNGKMKWLMRTKRIGNRNLRFQKFKEIFIDCSESLTLSIFCDDRLIVNMLEVTSGRQKIYFPQNLNARDCEIEISSFGQLNSIAVTYYQN